ncbi:MAG: WYL domain-containing protein [Roseburia sp.]|nr:WYL domain-containing protein [Anaeroplasma bactoclasticum]MCM1196097.1 WYL domain-containing protein [Roseburia sp.]MCM1557337.1 WYL domain-containing protein [Anaeroplasma bactoclasticum]
MNKTMLCIEILQLLSAKNIMNKNEIAEVLEINPRNVIEYIKTLQYCGYDIESVRGVYGGYHLNKDSLLPAVKLNQKEVDLLKSSVAFLERQSDFLEYKDYLKAISKVLSTNMESFSTDIKIIDRYPLAMAKEELLKRYTVFTEAISSHKKCEIIYLSSKNKESTHIIHPYQVFVFNGSWLVLAWNETVNEFGYFKLNRIQSLHILPSKFTILRTFQSSNYIDQYGMKQNGEYYDIKLELTDLYTVISERIYGKNQKITKIDEHKTILECSMQNKNIIQSFVLGFGSKAKVIEPEWLKAQIELEAKRILGEKNE